MICWLKLCDAEATKTADARVVLAATMATYMLPFEKVTPIVTDHAYSGSCPGSQLFMPSKTYSMY